MRMLLATDGSEDARVAVDWLATFPLPPASRLWVVSVLSIPTPALDVPPMREFQQSMRDEARRVAEAARAALAKRFVESDIEVVEGDAREEILRVAETWPADLIVLGARGLGAGGRSAAGQRLPGRGASRPLPGARREGRAARLRARARRRRRL